MSTSDDFVRTQIGDPIFTLALVSNILRDLYGCERGQILDVNTTSPHVELITADNHRIHLACWRVTQ